MATLSFAASRNFEPDVPKYFVIAISSVCCSINLVTVVSRYLFVFKSPSSYASRSMSIRYFVTAISSSACYRNLVTVISLLIFIFFVLAISSEACSRNLVTEVSFVLVKYLVIAISSSTCSSCFSRGYSMSRNLVTVMSLDA